MKRAIKIEHLVGKTLASIVDNGDSIEFRISENESYKMYHDQDCCESVEIDDLNGDLEDLIGTPILVAEERTSNDKFEDQHIEYVESFTWTFYTLRTIKGTVDIRWFGESNGYYSESVEIYQIT